MYELIDTHATKLRFIFGSIIIIAGLILLSFIISSAGDKNEIFLLNNPGSSSSSENLSVDGYGGANAVTNSMSKMVSATITTANVVEGTVSGTMGSIASFSTSFGKAVGVASYRTVKSTANVSFNIISTIATTAFTSVVFVVQAPIKVVALASDSLNSSDITKTSTVASVPVIDTQLEELYANNTIINIDEILSLTENQSAIATSWPINGRVTTEFGVPHRPYQVTHTGLDISSGNRSGVTSVMPFRLGTVINVVKSRQGLGNYVVVDHGEGLTSVYAHLYSVSVQVGQLVDEASELGKEGSTGVSTGTHLHFEVRLNGQPTDPQAYISGRP